MDDNHVMVLTGRVQNGVVVLDGNPVLPEGTVVAVTYHDHPIPEFIGTKYIDLPLIDAGPPGTLNLTGEKIAELLDAEDAAPRR